MIIGVTQLVPIKVGGLEWHSIQHGVVPKGHVSQPRVGAKRKPWVKRWLLSSAPQGGWPFGRLALAGQWIAMILSHFF